MVADGSSQFQFSRALEGREPAPTHERIVERLGDALFHMEDVLAMLKAENATGVRSCVEPVVRRMYNDINGVMKQFSD